MITALQNAALVTRCGGLSCDYSAAERRPGDQMRRLVCDPQERSAASAPLPRSRISPQYDTLSRQPTNHTPLHQTTHRPRGDVLKPRLHFRNVYKNTAQIIIFQCRVKMNAFLGALRLIDHAEIHEHIYTIVTNTVPCQ